MESTYHSDVQRPTPAPGAPRKSFSSVSSHDEHRCSLYDQTIPSEVRHDDEVSIVVGVEFPSPFKKNNLAGSCLAYVRRNLSKSSE